MCTGEEAERLLIVVAPAICHHRRVAVALDSLSQGVDAVRYVFADSLGVLVDRVVCHVFSLDAFAWRWTGLLTFWIEVLSQIVLGER